MAVVKTVLGSGLVLLVAACGSSAPDSGNSGGNAGTNPAGSAGMPSGGASSFAGSGGASGGAAGAGGIANTGNGPTCVPPVDVFSPIVKLADTGCVDPEHPTKPTSRAVGYEVN